MMKLCDRFIEPDLQSPNQITSYEIVARRAWARPVHFVPETTTDAIETTAAIEM